MPKKKSAATETDPIREMVTEFSTMIESGLLDDYLTVVDDSLDIRVKQQAKDKAMESAAKKKTATTQAPKVVPEAPKRVKKVPTITPEVGESYQVVTEFPKIGGAKVKFVRYRKGDESKAVVEMLVGKPGNPKGKNVSIPVAALANLAKKHGAKKVASKKSVKKSK